MSLQVPQPPEGNSPVAIKAYIAALVDALEAADQQNRKLRQHLYVLSPELLIMESPDGTRFSLTVDNAGVVSGTAL